MKSIGPLSRRALSTTTWARAPAESSPGGFNMTLTDEQREMQDLARKFTRDEVMPRAQHYDESGEFPWDIVKKAHSIGLMNSHIPQEVGGLGMSIFDSCLVTEEIAFGCTGILLAIEGSGLGVSVFFWVILIISTI